ncbi:hypothetical protein BC835DRAFT_1393334 [Cytidiella melzeri]|nr:hypothetical protein BC835DRAFT_1393334 [Cytidiella melzeri]
MQLSTSLILMAAMFPSAFHMPTVSALPYSNTALSHHPILSSNHHSLVRRIEGLTNVEYGDYIKAIALRKPDSPGFPDAANFFSKMFKKAKPEDFREMVQRAHGQPFTPNHFNDAEKHVIDWLKGFHLVEGEALNQRPMTFWSGRKSITVWKHDDGSIHVNKDKK